MKATALILLLVCGCSMVQRCSGQLAASYSLSDPNRGVIFDQRLNGLLSLNTPFLDDQGEPVLLKDLFRGKPVILAMGYYQCPMLCGVVLNAFVQSLQEFPPRSATRDLNFIFISVDPTEGKDLARAKKETYVRRYGSPEAEFNWHFLTGSKESIQIIADEIGFHFRYDATIKQYVHPSGIVVLTPKGRISSYLLGVEFPPAKLQQAISFARQQEIGTPVENILLLCFSPNPTSSPIGRLVIYSLRIGAIFTVVSLILVIRFVSGLRGKGNFEGTHT